MGHVSLNLAQLEDDLLRMASVTPPGHEFCAAISELARTGRIRELHGVLPDVVYDELLERYRLDPGGFVANWRSLAQVMLRGFVGHARDRLTSLTHLQHSPGAADAPAWQAIQRALDGQKNDLLRAAFALELFNLIEPAVARARGLRECVVACASSEEADRYLDEATRCYFYGLFTACAGLCRSVLEEATRQKLPPQLARQIRSRYRNAPTLGNLLHEVNNNLQLTGIDSDFIPLANQVNDTGKHAVHQGLLAEGEAKNCLQAARRALELLLRKTAT